MLAITVELLLVLLLALAVLISVSLPSLRAGSRVLTPQSERAVERVKEQAKRTLAPSHR
jgi:hypothetical protein